MKIAQQPTGQCDHRNILRAEHQSRVIALDHSVEHLPPLSLLPGKFEEAAVLNQASHRRFRIASDCLLQDVQRDARLPSHAFNFSQLGAQKREVCVSTTLNCLSNKIFRFEIIPHHNECSAGTNQTIDTIQTIGLSEYFTGSSVRSSQHQLLAPIKSRILICGECILGKNNRHRSQRKDKQHGPNGRQFFHRLISKHELHHLAIEG